MKPTLFIHIPRTAGTVMSKYVNETIPDYQTVHIGRGCCPNGSNLSGRFIDTGHTRVGVLLARKIVSCEWYEKCFRFTFVRNTWDRLTSVYNFYHKNRYINRHIGRRLQRFSITWEFTKDFDTFVRAIVSDNWLGGLYSPPMDKSLMFALAHSQMEWLRWGVDFVGRYENLDADWKRLCEEIGIEHGPLHRYLNWKPTPWRDWYTNELRELVGNYYAEEIEHFGYKFDE